MRNHERRNHGRWIGLGVAVLAYLPALAAADHARRGFEVEIERLNATLAWDGPQWLLQVRYKVEMEGVVRRAASDLLISLEAWDGPLFDRNGQPLRFVVPLDRPTEIDDDELEFEGLARFALPARQGMPHDLRVVAEVVSPTEIYPLDRKSTRVETPCLVEPRVVYRTSVYHVEPVRRVHVHRVRTFSHARHPRAHWR